MYIKQIKSYLKSYKSQIVLIIVLSLGVSLTTAVAPFVTQRLIDNGLIAKEIYTVISCVAILIGFCISNQIMVYAQRIIEINISNDLGKELKLKALNHGMKLKPAFFKGQGFYKIISDAVFEISQVLHITQENFLTLVVVLFKTVGASVGLIILDWKLAIFIGALIPLKILINNNFAKKSKIFGEKNLEENKRYHGWFQDVIGGIVDIKLWNLYSIKNREYEEIISRINLADKNLILNSSKETMFTNFIQDFFLNAIYIIGAFFIIQSELTIGGLISFISFSGMLLAPVNIILQLRLILNQIKPSLASLEEYFNLEEETIDSLLHVDNVIQKIEFKDICVSFDGKDVIKNLNIVVNRGEKIALVGDNGSGKTTFLNLLLRLCEPTDGTILINDTPINQFDIEDYRGLFSVVTQDIHLFNGTIKDNVLLKGDKDEVDCISEYGFCVDFIHEWENGFLTDIGVEGTKLSGGEKQKIALLRALNNKAKILILDEATANYDHESEMQFIQFVKANHDFDFYFIVTHRTDVLNCVDKIIKLKTDTQNELERINKAGRKNEKTDESV